MLRKVKPASSLRGELLLPPDKSISQRAAIFSLLHEGESRIKNYSMAGDPLSTLACVEQLGARVKRRGDELRITGTGRNNLKPEVNDLECGNSGTCMRLLSGVIAGAGLSIKLTGDPSLSSRSMRRIITPLEMMGARILARDEDYAPLYITRLGDFKAIDYELPVASAQVKSCVLLAGLFGEEETTVIESVQSRDHTERLLKLESEVVDGRRHIRSSLKNVIPEQSYSIPADFSSAAFWLVAGSIVSDSEIVLKDVGLNPTRTALLDLLKQMNADIQIENIRGRELEPYGDLMVRWASLKSIKVDEQQVPNCIDEIPILSVAMAFAEGTSEIRGASELRHKETDRLSAIAHLLKEIGAEFEEKEDGFIIQGNPDLSFTQGRFDSFHDHRIAMAAAVLSLKGQKESSIRHADAAAISYPSFWNHLDSLTN
jgi:3-phosphoshikimate 1-carboxyvinyltransferase